MKAVLKYPGSKWKLANWITDNIPDHHSYVEPFFGSGAVFFKKEPSNIETINDLDGDVFNLFKVIRDNPEGLARSISMTPYSRQEYDQAFEGDDCTDEIEKARIFLVRCWQGHGFRTNGYKVGWKNDVQGRESAYAVRNWYRLPQWIVDVTDRLKQVQIENRPALEIINRFKYENVLIYCDPPYLLSTRTAKQYKHEMDDKDHVELLNALIDHPGKIILSGYDSELYNDLLKRWQIEKRPGYSEYQGSNKQEVIWMNYKPVDQICFHFMGVHND